ncbi:MAG TPA: (2Fe-2S)-binding protein [Vicinamibacteria bacterium]|nr:(2Fe-2S)-binding protein [Vicinamibacteria bacterium]
MSALVPACDGAWPGAEAPVEAPAMTRCECTGTSFAEVDRRMREEGRSLDEVSRRTGCGRTCTACLPDLKAYLAGRR